MKWPPFPPVEKCPTKSVLVDLNENNVFEEAKGTADENSIWSDDGLYLEKVNAHFSNKLFET